MPGCGLYSARSRHRLRAPISKGSVGQPPRKPGRHGGPPDSGAGCEGQAGGIRGVFFGLRRHTDSAEARRHDAESDLALRGRQTCQRVLHDFVLPLLRPGNRLPALLQYFRAAAGSGFPIFRRAG